MKNSPIWKIRRSNRRVGRNIIRQIHPRSLAARPWKMVVGRLLSYWEGNFSGAMLNFGGVLNRNKLQLGTFEYSADGLKTILTTGLKTIPRTMGSGGSVGSPELSTRPTPQIHSYSRIVKPRKVRAQKNAHQEEAVRDLQHFHLYSVPEELECETDEPDNEVLK